jgi:predicted GTPase
VKRVVIMGAAGRDFHNFNQVYRDDPRSEVVAFTAAQIPQIAGRRYPPALAGPRYPNGIPIVEETTLADLCRAQRIDEVVFAYSDITHEHVMHKASVALAAGADFVLLGPGSTMIEAAVPVIAVCAVRTGCGKSQVARWIARQLEARGLRVGVMRHPMPYGDLEAQAVQRFAAVADLDTARRTVEEREEYEPHLALGHKVYAGVDYRRIVDLAAGECDLILWDGGNNDFPFLRPQLLVVLVDPLRPGDETRYHPGEAVLGMADVVVIAKANSATPDAIAAVAETVRAVNPHAPVVRGASLVTLDEPRDVEGRRVLVIEDGPTLTHGGMAYGAGFVAARAGGATIVDPRPFAAGEIARLYRQYPHIGPVLPAVGYFAEQLRDLARTIEAAKVDVVVSATPADVGRLIDVATPIVRARYEFAEEGEPSLSALIADFLDSRRLASHGPHQ